MNEFDNIQFNAYYITEEDDGSFSRNIVKRRVNDLPKNSTLIKVHYSSLNYKDALSSTGHKGITRNFPFQPGVDASGEIVYCESGKYVPGEQVICTGYDLGMNTDGGFGEYIKVPENWIVPLPENLNLQEAMIFGTAGFTAALGIFLLERNGQQPEQGPVVVTGATGGVGSMAVALLSKAGYQVIASTGKIEEQSEFLRSLGAHEIVDRGFVNMNTDKLLLRSKWAGAIDTVGGNTLHTLLKACKPYGNVASCGLVESADLPISVYPFIINGISLLGIATAENPLDEKIAVWNKLANDWKIDQLHSMKQVISLEQLDEYVQKILAGKTVGRVVLKHSFI